MTAQLLIQQTSRHGVFVQGFAGHLANLFDPYLEEMRKEIRFILSEQPNTLKNQRRITKLVNDIRRLQQGIYDDYNEDVLIKELQEFAVSESEFELKSLENVVTSQSVDLILPTAKQVWNGVLSKPLTFPDQNRTGLIEPFIRGWEKSEVDRVSNIIRTGYITGQTTDEITRRITGKNGTLDKQTRQNTKAMVRTATNHTSNTARLETMQANDDITTGYELVATLDVRTTDYCKGIDGHIVKWSDDVQLLPPFHPQCRTQAVPVLDERFSFDDSAATRASKGSDGREPVSANETYYSWLGKQSAAFQDEALGPERGRLFRNGGLTAEEFRKLSVDKLFRPRTLEEMQRLNPLAFEKAGVD